MSLEKCRWWCYTDRTVTGGWHNISAAMTRVSCLVTTSLKTPPRPKLKSMSVCVCLCVCLRLSAWCIVLCGLWTCPLCKAEFDVQFMSIMLSAILVRGVKKFSLEKRLKKYSKFSVTLYSPSSLFKHFCDTSHYCTVAFSRLHVLQVPAQPGMRSELAPPPPHNPPSRRRLGVRNDVVLHYWLLHKYTYLFTYLLTYLLTWVKLAWVSVSAVRYNTVQQTYVYILVAQYIRSRDEFLRAD